MCHTKRADDLSSPHPGANGDARARGKPLRVVPAMRRAGAGRCCGRTRERTGRAQGEGREKGGNGKSRPASVRDIKRWANGRDSGRQWGLIRQE